jgi:hypothetical protein
MPFSNTDTKMNKQIDLKSALCGLAVGILAMLAIGAANPSNLVGRYQVVTAAGFAAIIDTTTGQTWGANLAGPPGFQTTHAGFWEKKVDKE